MLQTASGIGTRSWTRSWAPKALLILLLVRDAEKNYKILMEENPDLVQAARRGNSVVDPETGLIKTERRSSVEGEKDGMRKGSLVAGGGDQRRPSLTAQH